MDVTEYSLTRCVHWHALWAVNFLSLHQLAMPLQNIRSAPWNPFPSRWYRYPGTSKTSLWGRSHMRPSFPTRNVARSSSLHLLVHHNDSVQQFFIDVIHHACQSLFVVTKLPTVVRPHHAPQHVLVVFLPTEGEPPSSSFPFFLSFPYHTFGHTSPKYWSLHTTIADTLRKPQRRFIIFTAGRTANVLHLASKAAAKCP